MISVAFRALPALALLIGGGVALNTWRKRERKAQAKKDLHEDLNTWEGEGGNLPTGPATGGAPSAATGSSGGIA